MAKKRDKNPFNITVKSILFTILLLYALSMILVLLWGLITSLKNSADLDVGNYLGLPNLKWSREEALKLANYQGVFKDMSVKARSAFYSGSRYIVHTSNTGFIGLVFNTIMYSIVGSLLASVVPAIVGYLCAKFKYKLSGIIYTVVIITMTIPIIGNTPATVNLLRSLGLYDTFMGYFIQRLGFGGMYFLMYYAFFLSFSDTYIEAAEIDGANHYAILLKIIIPLSLKMIGTVFLIMFVSYWNDYTTALMFMPTHPTLAYAIYLKAVGPDASVGSIPYKIAACMMLAIPILIIFVFFKDKIMGNLTMGGIKG